MFICPHLFFGVFHTWAQSAKANFVQRFIEIVIVLRLGQQQHERLSDVDSGQCLEN